MRLEVDWEWTFAQYLSDKKKTIMKNIQTDL